MELPLQPPPAGGTATDLWFYRVVTETIEHWRAAYRPDNNLRRTAS
jgi:hypothetical protein